MRSVGLQKYVKKTHRKETKKVAKYNIVPFLLVFSILFSGTVFMFETNMNAVTLSIFYYGITTLQGKHFVFLFFFSIKR